MIRFGQPIGFIFGVVIGIKTRDYFMYPYALRVQDLEQDFRQFEGTSTQMERELEKKINYMAS